jgi:type IV secretory pathway VirB10-like protein
VALGSLPLLVWMLWPASPKAGAAKSASTRAASQALDERQVRELAKLPDLSKLDKAGELPHEDRMYWDLFLFEGPPPPPPAHPPAPPPPPPPPTKEQLEAEQLRQDRAQETATRPQNLRYLGYLGSVTAGRLGAFMKGEDPVTIKQGDLANPHWRLVKLTDIAAEFQNLKYADLKHKLDAVDVSGQGGRAGQAHSNEF